MNANYRPFFQLHKEPFASDIEKEHILVTYSLTGIKERIHYAMLTGAVALVTGEFGSGKSTALRYVTESLHPSEHLCLYVTATSGSPDSSLSRLMSSWSTPRTFPLPARMVSASSSRRIVYLPREDHPQVPAAPRSVLAGRHLATSDHLGDLQE